ncbi:MAG: transcriptional regulator [Nocardia sp.]|uniref:TetR/AcrR family transcriptional regulator n=1 Tax=Nocardia sp. TaxID=1821 RepID=UPI002634810F|nr:TetR/AcrR family transcriptional regulator [Nocardia sp.]MCU1646116.1 transcriptional regulator [Nocardia sp.]
MSDPGSEKAKRVRLTRDQRRKQLIALGADMLAERAAADISVDEIARQAGISPSLLFYYFDSKHEFRDAIVRHISAELLTAIAPDRELALFDMFRNSIEGYVGYVEHHGDAYRAILSGFPGHTGAIAKAVLAEVPIASDDPDRPRLALAIRGWVAFVNETALIWLDEKPISREQLIDVLVESLVALALSSTLANALRR